MGQRYSRHHAQGFPERSNSLDGIMRENPDTVQVNIKKYPNSELSSRGEGFFFLPRSYTPSQVIRTIRDALNVEVEIGIYIEAIDFTSSKLTLYQIAKQTNPRDGVLTCYYFSNDFEQGALKFQDLEPNTEFRGREGYVLIHIHKGTGATLGDLKKNLLLVQKECTVFQLKLILRRLLDTYPSQEIYLLDSSGKLMNESLRMSELSMVYKEEGKIVHMTYTDSITVQSCDII